MQQELTVWEPFSSIHVGEIFFLNLFVLLPYLLQSPFLPDYSIVKASLWPRVMFKYIFCLEQCVCVMSPREGWITTTVMMPSKDRFCHVIG